MHKMYLNRKSLCETQDIVNNYYDFRGFFLTVFMDAVTGEICQLSER